MPWYRMGGVMVHLKLSGKAAKNPPAACPHRIRLEHKEGAQRIERCMAMAPYLCDWPGCNVPFCEDHRLSIGPDLDVCPTHNHKRGLFSRLLPAPT